MSARQSVCIRCGKHKARPLAICSACNFIPKSENDQARSLILSPSFDAGEEVIGNSPEALQVIAGQIQAGVPYEFDKASVERVRRLHVAARATTSRQLLSDLLRWLGPPVLVGLIAAYWAFSRT